MNGYYSAVRYSDAQEHASSLRNFSQDYFQVENGSFGSALMQAELGGLRVYSESVDRGIVQHAHLDARCVAMGWRIGDSGASNGGSRRIDGSSGSMLRGGQDWMLRLEPGTQLCGITMPVDEFDRLAEPLGVPLLEARHALIAPSPRALANMHWSLTEIARQAPRLAIEGVRASLREQLLESCFQAFCEATPSGRPDVTRLSYQKIVRRSQELAFDSPDRPPSALELCAQLRVSRRTLQNSFSNVLGQSPLVYLRCVRLGHVRRLLRTMPTHEMSIGDAAARWGFFHVGHFANDYRTLFGELPSQTVRSPQRR